MTKLDQKRFEGDLGMGRKFEGGLSVLQGLEAAKKILLPGLVRFAPEKGDIVFADGQDILRPIHGPNEEQIPEVENEFF
jgi:hypothetical protein